MQSPSGSMANFGIRKPHQNKNSLKLQVVGSVLAGIVVFLVKTSKSQPRQTSPLTTPACQKVAPGWTNGTFPDGRIGVRAVQSLLSGEVRADRAEAARESKGRRTCELRLINRLPRLWTCTNSSSSTLSLSEFLDDNHLKAVGRILRNILALPLALETSAQMLNGTAFGYCLVSTNNDGRIDYRKICRSTSFIENGESQHPPRPCVSG
jgi:hypothetical protein